MKKMLLIAIVAMATIALPAQKTQNLKLSPALQERFDGYMKELSVFDKQLEELQHQAEADKSRVPELQEAAMAIFDKRSELLWQIVKANPDNLIPTAFVSELAYSLDYDQLKELCTPSNAYYADASMDLPKRLLAGMEKRAPGKMFVDMTISDMDGQLQKLSQWCGRGQYVLIDFWASWCGPCRQEMPNVVANYAKYHSKGFEIVGISFDSKEKSWKNAVDQMGMTWPQLSDLGGWKSAAAGVYGISSIPASILLDGTGKIVALDLRGDKLGNKLKEIYGF